MIFINLATYVSEVLIIFNFICLLCKTVGFPFTAYRDLTVICGFIKTVYYCWLIISLWLVSSLECLLFSLLFIAEDRLDSLETETKKAQKTSEEFQKLYETEKAKNEDNEKSRTDINSNTLTRRRYLSKKKLLLCLTQRSHWSHMLESHLACLKTLYTIGHCQRLVFTVCVSQHMHKITNLWKFELNWSSKLWDMNERKNTLLTSCVLSDAWFLDLKF